MQFAKKFAKACIWGLAAVDAGVGIREIATAQQQPSHRIEVQRQAMGKLSFLAGHWSGTVSMNRGPGAPGPPRTGSGPQGDEPLRMTHTESVQFKLDGIVLLIEGRSTAVDGKAAFAALATIAYDDEAGKYRIRAYNDGRYLDTDLALLADGFSWGFQAGPVHVVNTMHLTPKGQWHETAQVTVGDNPPQQAVDMLLDREK